MKKTFFHDATRKTRTTCKISIFFEDFNFLNPRRHLNQVVPNLYTARIDMVESCYIKGVQKHPFAHALQNRCPGKFCKNSQEKTCVKVTF